MKQALQFKPVAVGFSGLPARGLGERRARSTGRSSVKIVTMYLGPTKYDDTVIGQVGGPKDVNEYGQIIGNWVVADSNGKANILLQEVNDFPILKDYVTGFKKVVQQELPDLQDHRAEQHHRAARRPDRSGGRRGAAEGQEHQLRLERERAVPDRPAGRAGRCRPDQRQDLRPRAVTSAT